jgi:hypothetical protein
MARSRPVETPPPLTIEFKHVSLKDLIIPIDIYQRPASRRVINAIKEMGWDTGLQTVILVSAETNRVLDGGHRVQAARELGIEQLPALVYHGLSEKDEARYFVNLNRLRRPVGLRARHRAELLAGGAEASEAQKVVEALALKRAPLQTIHAANERYPGVLLSLAPILNQMEGRAFSRDFIAGMTHFAATHPLTEETRIRLTEPGMHAAINIAIKQVMQEHMRSHNRVALPTDWSVKGEGVLLALNTRAARIPREHLIPA